MFLIIIPLALSLVSIIIVPIINLILRKVRLKPSQDLSEATQIQSEMNLINMKEDFAKYIKLQRRRNKLFDKHKSEVKETTRKNNKLRIILIILLQTLLSIIYAFCFWMYRSTPVISLDQSWFKPIDSILSWPTGVQGAISFPTWVIICRNSIAAILNMLNYEKPNYLNPLQLLNL